MTIGFVIASSTVAYRLQVFLCHMMSAEATTRIDQNTQEAAGSVLVEPLDESVEEARS